MRVVPHHVRQVRVRVPRRRNHAHGEPAHLQHVPVGDRRTVEGNVVCGVDQVLGPELPGEDQASGDVVIVEVGFGHMRDTDTRCARGFLHAVGVALGVDGNHDDLHLFRVVLQQGHGLGQFGHCRGADVGAVGIAEEHHHHLALVVGERAQLARAVDHGHAAADIGARNVRSLELGG